MSQGDPDEGRASAPADSRYELIRTLADHGKAVTELCRDRETGRSVVRKRLSLARAESVKTVELFEREARLLANLTHPGIPRLVEAGTYESDDHVEIITVRDYIEGESLTSRIEQGRHWSEAEVIGMALELCGIVEYLHGLSPPIIHRDLKPPNIIHGLDGRLFLVDFGAAMIGRTPDSLAGAPTVVGSYGYTPIEQFEGRARPASDLYALGGVMVYLLSHKEPLELDRRGIEIDFEPHVNVSPGLVRVLRKLLAPNWQDRYPDARSLRQHLELLAGGGELPQTGRRWLVPVVAGAAVAILLGSGWWLLAVPPETPLTPVKIAHPTPRSPVTTPKPVFAPPIAGPESDAITGLVVFDGEIIDSPIEPTFWFRDEELSIASGARIEYAHGRFAFHGLPTHRMGVATSLDRNPENPEEYPGDLRSWTVFEASPGTQLTIEVHEILHLTSPQDNGTVMESWGVRCEEKPTFTNPVRLAWDGRGPYTAYDVAISMASCDPGDRSYHPVRAETTQQTELAIELPPSPPDEYYVMTLNARRNGRLIGSLMTHGASGHGWDYRFRVR